MFAVTQKPNLGQYRSFFRFLDHTTITHTHTHTHIYIYTHIAVGILWTSDQLVAEAAT